ncbi:hypothetical protein ACFVWG_17770 [Kribbella sp. NPDC058245]|uniref:hypothetical protein n=1 Tax=Kribbella sp. NPDC058245 TaxID=3346399 RepID=UPI0036EE3EA0
MTDGPKWGDLERDQALAEISAAAAQIEILLRSPDFVRPSGMPDMLLAIVAMADQFTRPPFGDGEDATGQPPWIADATETAARELMFDIQRILMREAPSEDLERLCLTLVDRGLSAARETLRTAENFDIPDKASELRHWTDSIEELRQRQLVLRSRVALRAEIAGIKEVAAEVAQVAADSRDSATTVGELELASYFELLAASERRSANKYRISAIAILVVSAILVYVASFDSKISAADVIRHVAFVVPAVGLSTYLGAEASKHRRSAQWAEVVKVQLRTIGLFCASMDIESAISIRKLLANRVFGTIPGEGVESPSATGLSPTALEQVLGLLRTSKNAS